MTNRNENSPLSLAVINGWLNWVSFFIAKKADLNAQNRLGHSPLHLASKEGFDDIATKLIQAGANLEITDM